MICPENLKFNKTYVLNSHNLNLCKSICAISLAKNFAFVGEDVLPEKNCLINCKEISSVSLSKINSEICGEYVHIYTNLFSEYSKVHGFCSVDRENSVKLIKTKGRFERNNNRVNASEIRLAINYIKNRLEQNENAEISVINLEIAQKNQLILKINSLCSENASVKNAFEQGRLRILHVSESQKMNNGETLILTTYAFDNDGIFPMNIPDNEEFAENLYRIISNTHKNLCVISSIDFENYINLRATRGFLKLLSLLRICDTKCVALNVNNLIDVEENNLPTQNISNYLRKNEIDLNLSDKSINKFIDIELLNSEKEPYAAVLTDKAGAGGTNELLYNSKELQKAGYNIHKITSTSYYLDQTELLIKIEGSENHYEQ